MPGRLLLGFIALCTALLALTAPAAAQPWPTVELRDKLCTAQTARELSVAEVFEMTPDCVGEPRDYQHEWLWLFADPKDFKLVAGEQPAHLLIDQTRFDRIRVLLRYADGSIVPYDFHDGELGRSWGLGGHLDFDVPYNGQQLTGVAIGFENMVHYPLMRKVRLMHDPAFDSMQHAWIMTLGLVLGAMGATLMYNLFLYAGVADAFQRIYVLWAISAFVYALCWSNLIFYVFPGLAGTTGVRLNMVAASGVLTFGTLFFTLFIEPGRLPRWYRRTLDGIAIGILFAGLLAALDPLGLAPEMDKAFNLLATVNLALLLSGIAIAWVGQSRAVTFYALAWAAPLFVVGARLARNFGYVGQNDLVDMATFLSITVQTVLLSLGIADRLGRLKGERDQATAEREEMRLLAETDLLTGLYNRRGFVTRAQALLARPGPFGLLVTDLDHFKAINDRLGHNAGDNVLERVGRIIAEATEGTYVAGRLGGEEFGVAARLDGPELEALAERLRLAIADADMTDLLGPAASLTMSVGLTDRRADPEISFERLYNLADQALYRAKQLGRNRIAAPGIAA
ncbi:diguanylate cyclase [Sphingoaurantiacus capsulatus]|uniref:diguanylate cyclase n=1 Tax=Sphingoaurantiacus capsulatus TaxID=1771310 RepID=A0ABV7XCT6_9SPHN